MVEVAPSHCTLAELEQMLKDVDPAVLLVPPRILRRVIRLDCQLPKASLHVPHRKSYVLPRDQFLRLADRDELGLGPGSELPATLLLLARPEPAKLAAMSRPAVLLKYWRLLFHIRAHLSLRERFSDGNLNEASLRARIHRIGTVAFHEVRTVLRQEQFLLPPLDNRCAYLEFLVVYSELKFFDPRQLELYFPALAGCEDVGQLVSEDLDAERLLGSTRLPGAPDPNQSAGAPESATCFEIELEGKSAGDGRFSNRFRTASAQQLLQNADEATRRGNVVRAALLRSQAASVAPLDQAPEILTGMRADLDRLVQRLQPVLELGDTECELLRNNLPHLLEGGRQDLWPPEARLLYDLQRVCLSTERNIYAVDLVEWALSFGRRPIKRPLPSQHEILALKYLRSAFSRLASVKLVDEDRRVLARLLRDAIRRGEERVRDWFRPLLTFTLDEVGLQPRNNVERVAYHKLVEELLDLIAERGFLNMGDLRDALSRNQLKLPDLTGPREFLFGDRLLRANSRLAIRLDGVYRRGEVYLRWLHSFSSAAFGTVPGRFLTRYIALPLGGAYIILEGLQHLVESVSKLFGLSTHHVAAAVERSGEMLEALEQSPAHAPSIQGLGEAKHGVHMLNAYSFTLLGLFLLGLINVPAFRHWIVKLLGLFFHTLRNLLIDLPTALVQMPLVHKFFTSWPVRVCLGYVIKPLALALPASLIFPLLDLGSTERGLGTLGLLLGLPPSVVSALVYLDAYSWPLGIVLFYFIAVVLLHSRLWRDLEESLAERLVRGWAWLSRDLLLGVVLLVLGFFKRGLGLFEKILYSVDEWLRFYSGEGRLSLVLKPLLGVVWFLVTYVLRFCVVLMIEPQINPIKHFPVVTVSHKLMLPFFFPLTNALWRATGLDYALVYTLSSIIYAGIPGIFGFLVWELKENWRLYQANRPLDLQPVIVGHHGETLSRLLRPGFHAGTVPKLYAQLRRTWRKCQREGRWRAYRIQWESLHHVEEAVHRLVDRELLTLLEQSHSWKGVAVHLGAVTLTTNSIGVELTCTEWAATPLKLRFTEESGWLVVRIDSPGWLVHLTFEQRQDLAIALAGFYKIGDVDVVAEQLRAQLGSNAYFFDITKDGLVVSQAGRGEAECVYDLNAGPLFSPRNADGTSPTTLPTLTATQLFFENVTIPWQGWVNTWEEQDQKRAVPSYLRGVCFLPKRE